MQIRFTALFLAAAATYQHVDAFTAVQIGRTLCSTSTMFAIHGPGPRHHRGSISSSPRGMTSGVVLNMMARTANARGVRRPENVEGNFFVRSLPYNPMPFASSTITSDQPPVHPSSPSSPSSSSSSSSSFPTVQSLSSFFLQNVLNFPVLPGSRCSTTMSSSVSPSCLFLSLPVPHSLCDSLSPTRCCFHVRWISGGPDLHQLRHMQMDVHELHEGKRQIRSDKAARRR